MGASALTPVKSVKAQVALDRQERSRNILKGYASSLDFDAVTMVMTALGWK